ncbi:MAG: ATP-dependent helicase [Candidatus Eremiobacteraeota bacterium]|nr:ATP-dependent helicase [Candidatus Eremiobacteraeota bacterium]
MTPERTAPVLSAEQERAVRHPVGAAAVVEAGAGTGKTFTIVERVAALHESGKIPADKILLLTFARKAAAELRARIAQRLRGLRPECSTFHAFAWHVLSSRAYDIGLSPDAQVIEDVDARVEFRNAFLSVLGAASAAGCGFPLRPFNQQEIRDGLFTLSQELQQRGISGAEFRQRALEAAEAFARIPYCVIREPAKARGTPKDIAWISGAALAREVAEEKARVETAAAVLSAFEQRLAERRLVTYADILLRAEAAIRTSPELRRELLDRHPYCIVDEYQDTDLAQHRLLAAIYGAEMRNVMVVGDVLQSIYAFRGAHPENIDLIKASPGAAQYPLVHNRRSRQEILDLAHEIISAAHPEAAQLHGVRGPAETQVIEVASLWRDENGDHLLADDARVVEAGAVTRTLGALLDGTRLVDRPDGTRTPLVPHDIAILSRTKTNVQPVTEALLGAGIPFRLVGGVGFYDAPEIRDALAWLRLLADPFDAPAITRALQSPVIGLSDAAMTDMARGLENDETAFARRVLVEPLDRDSITSSETRARLAKFHASLDRLAPFSALPLSAAVHAVLEQTGMLEHWRTSPLVRSGQAQANLAKLVSLAREIEHANRGAQAADFVAFVQELERVDYDEREADVSAADVVTISTIHAAKGLEWPVVFVLGVWPQPRGASRLRIDWPSGALLYAESPDGTRPFHYIAVEHRVGPDGMAGAGEGAEKEEKKTEERRLLYVALTRARDLLFISGLRSRPSKSNPQGKPNAYLEPIYDWFARKGWLVERPAPASRPFRSVAHAPAIGPTRTPAVHEGAHEQTPVPSLSYSLVAGFERCPRRITYQLMFRIPGIARGPMRWRMALEKLEALDATDMLPEDALLGSGEFGSLLHKALELWALDVRARAAPVTSAAYVEGACRFLDLSPGTQQRHKAESVITRVMHALAGWQPLEAEAPFTLDFGSEAEPLLMTGYIDLLALDDRGRACVVDYKSGTVDATGHALQLALYRRAAELVYGHAGAQCYIGRVVGDAFSLQQVEALSEGQLRERIMRVREGLKARDDTPRPGIWCFQCPYRGAPCQDYLRSTG